MRLTCCRDIETRGSHADDCLRRCVRCQHVIRERQHHDCPDCDLGRFHRRCLARHREGLCPGPRDRACDECRALGPASTCDCTGTR